MGFFSWNCRGCGESMKAPYDLKEEDAWQNDVVVVTEDNKIIAGDYDGYGRVGCEDLSYYKFECWHQKCYISNGQPTTYTEQAQAAQDQGYFYQRSN